MIPPLGMSLNDLTADFQIKRLDLNLKAVWFSVEINSYSLSLDQIKGPGSSLPLRGKGYTLTDASLED